MHKSELDRHWQHRSRVPIAHSPVFVWPPSPLNIARWVAARWLNVCENAILVLVSLVSWFYFQPSLQAMHTLAFGWIAEMYLRNLTLMLIVAGGLHLYFYTFGRQADRLKFDPRAYDPPTVPGRPTVFAFGSQLRDNVFWTLASGVAFWTAYEVLMFWAMANGLVPWLQWRSNPVWFVAMIFLTPMWISLHFYWVHRLLHWPPMYRRVHGLHHRNTNVGPWSGLSMHPLEHLLFFSSILIHWVVAAHPIHILFHMQHQALTAATSHTGFENLLVNGEKRLALGTFHHQLHHRYFRCNYGNLEVPLDHWLGSFHDGTDAAHEKMLDQRRGPAPTA